MTELVVFYALLGFGVVRIDFRGNCHSVNHSIRNKNDDYYCDVLLTVKTTHPKIGALITIVKSGLVIASCPSFSKLEFSHYGK